MKLPWIQKTASAPAIALRAGALLAAAALSACYVVPIDPKTGQPYPTHSSPAPVVVVQQPAQSSAQNTAVLPVPVVYNVRLYPTNEQARAIGILQATVIDASGSRGGFTVNYGGQALQGEATRVDRNYPGFGSIMQAVQGAQYGVNWSQTAGQRGIANAAGAQSSLRCEYLFTSATQGTGACLASDGAKFQAHFGS